MRLHFRASNMLANAMSARWEPVDANDGVVSFRDQINEPVFAHHLQLNVRILCRECGGDLAHGKWVNGTVVPTRNAGVDGPASPML